MFLSVYDSQFFTKTSFGGSGDCIKIQQVEHSLNPVKFDFIFHIVSYHYTF